MSPGQADGLLVVQHAWNLLGLSFGKRFPDGHAGNGPALRLAHVRCFWKGERLSQRRLREGLCILLTDKQSGCYECGLG